MSEPTKRKQRDRSHVERKSQRRPWKAPRVPPPDSSIWPEQYRGANWKSVYATLFAGRCQLCAYSCPLPSWRQLRDKFHGEPRLLLCTNHPNSPGELHEVLPIETCRNFQAKRWQQPCRKAARELTAATTDACEPQVRRIPVGHGLFATVDAADYEEVRKYRWRAIRHGRNAYAATRKNGRTVYMHRMFMRPRKGYVVDHIDGNGLNNRRCNLRVCTPAQNLANKGPRGGSSPFVGVYRSKDKWVAHVMCRGKHYYVGAFADEVAAAKARDRKAYELHGQYAYLNFPEDLAR
jgi:HNH endonuclease